MNVPKGEQVEAGLVNNKDRIEDENAEIGAGTGTSLGNDICSTMSEVIRRVELQVEDLPLNLGAIDSEIHTQLVDIISVYYRREQTQITG